MFADAKDVLAQVSGPADLAVVLLGGSVGFLVDAGLNAIGFLSPGEVGVTAATVALGAKKAYEASRKDQRAAALKLERHAKAVDRAQTAMHVLASRGLSGEVLRLETELELFGQGLSDRASLDEAVDVALVAYRLAPSGEAGSAGYVGKSTVADP